MAIQEQLSQSSEWQRTSPEQLRKALEDSPYCDQIISYAGSQFETLFYWPEHCGGLLTDRGILRHMLAGNIVVEPFDIRQLQPNG